MTTATVTPLTGGTPNLNTEYMATIQRMLRVSHPHATVATDGTVENLNVGTDANVSGIAGLAEGYARDHDYRDAVRALFNVPNGNMAGHPAAKYVTLICPDCGGLFSEAASAGHWVVGMRVVVTCDGRWVVDPALVGITVESWEDWTVRPTPKPEDAAYVAAVTTVITETDESELDAHPAWPWLSPICPECGECPPPADRDHIVVGDHVVVGCEGYWVVNPAAVGIDASNWQDWG